MDSNFLYQWVVWYLLPGGLLLLSLFVWLGHALAKRRKKLLGPRSSELIMHAAPRLRMFKLVLIFIGFTMLALAVARPRWGRITDNFPRGGSELMLVVDVSNSMLVKDMGVSRLDWAKNKIAVLLSELSKNPIHRVGMMPFAGEPFVLVPPTPDYSAVHSWLDDLGPLSVGKGGSDLARAIDEARASLLETPGQHKAILVISDGDVISPSESGSVKRARDKARKDAVSAARDAVSNPEKRVRVFALGVGDEKLAREIITADKDGHERTIRYEDEEGQKRVAMSALSEITLSEIARTGRGAYVHSTLDETDIQKLLQEGLVDSEVFTDEKDKREVLIERFRIPLILAFALLALEFVIPLGATKRRKN